MKNLLQLADVIESTVHDNDLFSDGESKVNHFSMAYINYDCGTPSCIAGWAAALKRGTKDLRGSAWVEGEAAEWLGLPYDWAYNNLFYPNGCGYRVDYKCIGPKQAARVLRAVAAHGTEQDMAKVWEECER